MCVQAFGGEMQAEVAVHNTMCVVSCLLPVCVFDGVSLGIELLTQQQPQSSQ